MRRYTPILLACALLSWYVPMASPLVVGHNARLVRRPMYRYEASAQSAAEPRPNNMKMSNPSTPVPRNIKDTVSCLRAAVQVRVGCDPVAPRWIRATDCVVSSVFHSGVQEVSRLNCRTCVSHREWYKRTVHSADSSLEHERSCGDLLVVQLCTEENLLAVLAQRGEKNWRLR